MKKKIAIILIFILAGILFLYLFLYGPFLDNARLSVFNSKLLCKSLIDNFESNKCLINIARQKKDESVCQERFRNVFFSGNTDVIDISLEEARSSCYMEVAMIKEDISLCDKTTFDRHTFYCYMVVARKTNRIDYCDKIPEVTEILSVDRDQCIREVEASN